MTGSKSADNSADNLNLVVQWLHVRNCVSRLSPAFCVPEPGYARLDGWSPCWKWTSSLLWR